MTGTFGVVCFIAGTLLEEDASNTLKTIMAGAILAIGIGSVTGGLQHFPDSPERSLLIIPIGYITSMFFFVIIHKYKLTRKEYSYMVLSSIFILIFSIGIFFLIENTDIIEHSHDGIENVFQNEMNTKHHD